MTNTTPTILVYRKPGLSDLMRDIPDDTPWSELALGGTHDSTAFYGVPYAQCQRGGTSVTEQLQDGAYTATMTGITYHDCPLGLMQRSA